MKKNAVVYPYNSSVSGLVRYRNLIKNYNIVKVISLKSFCLENKDAALADEGRTTNLIVSTEYYKDIIECDTVILADFNMKKIGTKFYNKLKEDILYAIKYKKDVVSIAELDEEFVSILRKASKQESTNFIYYSDLYKNCSDFDIEMHPIDTPIITVVGLNEDCSKFEIQLAIRQRLIESGIRVSQIGSKHYCEIFGFHSFPKYMYDNSLTDEDKIKQFNFFLKNIEKEEAPDIIILGVPYGLLPTNERISQKFGLPAYYAGCAIGSSFVILMLPYSDLNNWNIDLLSEMIKYKIGDSPSCICMSNNRLNSADLLEEHKGFSVDRLPYTSIDTKLNNISEIKIPCFSSMSETGQDSLCNFIINRFIPKDSIIDKKSFKEISKKDIDKWIDMILYKVFKINTNAEDNCLMNLNARDFLYLQAEIIKRFNVCISIQQIKEGLIFSKESLINCIYHNLNLDNLNTFTTKSESQSSSINNRYIYN